MHGYHEALGTHTCLGCMLGVELNSDCTLVVFMLMLSHRCLHSDTQVKRARSELHVQALRRAHGALLALLYMSDAALA